MLILLKYIIEVYKFSFSFYLEAFTGKMARKQEMRDFFLAEEVRKDTCWSFTLFSTNKFLIVVIKNVNLF